jgi:hypothetical protein
MRDGEMDQPASAVGQAVHLGRCLVTEDGARSGPQQSAPELGGPASGAVERGIDTAVHRLPAAGAHLIPNVLSGHSSLKSLPNAKHPTLAINQPKAFTRNLGRHGTSVRTPDPTAKARPGTCG